MSGSPWFNFTRGFQEHFSVGKQLGAGAYGCTHIVTEKSTAQQYAVKILPKSEMQSESDREAVEREVKILKMVSPQNAHIVTLYGVFEDDTNVYLLLELCTGGELFEHLADLGSFSEADAAALIRQILRVTAECHNAGIAHRDLKPENFLYVFKGASIIKAIDFGLSDFFTPTTKFTNITGSPYYVAPEVLLKNSGHAADVWSVGVIAYVLLCGGPPFYGDTDNDLFNSIINDPLDLESDPWPTVSESAKDLIRRLMMKDPKKRLSASQALSHPWVREGGSAPDIPLCYDVVTSLNRFAKQSKLKRLFFTLFAQEWPETNQIQSLTDQFKTIDKDGSGMISFAEFKAAVEGIKMGEQGQNVFDSSMINDMCTSLDADGDGTIDYKEFLAAAVQTLKVEKDEKWRAGVNKAFAVLDKDGDGKLSIQELAPVLGVSSRETHTMMAEIDKDGDGEIDIEEFRTVLSSGLQSTRVSLDLSDCARSPWMKAISVTDPPGPPPATSSPPSPPPPQQPPAPQPQQQAWQQQPQQPQQQPHAWAQSHQPMGMPHSAVVPSQPLPGHQPWQPQQPQHANPAGGGGRMGNNVFAGMPPAMVQQIMMMPPAQQQQMMMMIMAQRQQATPGMGVRMMAAQSPLNGSRQHMTGVSSSSSPPPLPATTMTGGVAPPPTPTSTGVPAKVAGRGGGPWPGLELVRQLQAEVVSLRQELKVKRRMAAVAAAQRAAVKEARRSFDQRREAERRTSRDDETKKERRASREDETEKRNRRRVSRENEPRRVLRDAERPAPTYRSSPPPMIAVTDPIEASSSPVASTPEETPPGASSKSTTAPAPSAATSCAQQRRKTCATIQSHSLVDLLPDDY